MKLQKEWRQETAVDTIKTAEIDSASYLHHQPSVLHVETFCDLKLDYIWFVGIRVWPKVLLVRKHKSKSTFY